MSITVSYSTGVIKIDSTEIKTSTFYTLGIHDNVVKLNGKNNDIFTDEQRDLRALDMMKDGSIGNNISSSVYGIAYPGRVPLPFNVLHTLEDKFINHFEKTNKIKKYAWTKVTKDSKLNPILPSRTIFKESGLDTEYFIDNPSFVMNFANEVIDPAGRAPYNPKTDIIFPPVNTKLEIKPSFLHFFGFIGCSLDATKRGNTANYDYSINIKDLTITKQDKKSKMIDWFQGNQKKNGYIKNGKPTTEIKNGLLVCKELGDVLQILLMFIWHHLHKDKPYAMSTCDKVVFLQCMLLNLNCILTSADRKNGARLRCIQMYNAEEDTLEKAKARFEEEKQNILKHNDEFIKCIQKLAANPVEIHMSGTNNTYKFPSNFYNEIKFDLSHINDILKKQTVSSGLKDINSINAFITTIKQNFAFDLFLRKNKTGTISILQNRKYTFKNDLWKSGQQHTFITSYGSLPFFEIGRYYMVRPMQPFQRIVPIGRTRHGGENTPRSDEYSYLEFDDTPVIYTDYDDDLNPIKVDLLDELKNNIRQHLDSINMQDYFDDFYNELLYRFYLNDDVLYGGDQLKMIYDIKKEFAIRNLNALTRKTSTVKKRPLLDNWINNNSTRSNSTRSNNTRTRSNKRTKIKTNQTYSQ